MCALATARRFARALRGWRAYAARRRESRRAAWRCKLRVGAADCIAGRCKGCIRAAEQRFCNRFQQRAVWTTQWCCTRARGGRGLRDAEMHRLTNRDCGLSASRRTWDGVKVLFLVAFIRNKAATGPEGGIPQIAPAEHARHSASTEHFAAEQTQRPHGNERLPSRRRRGRRERRGQCCPGHTVIITRRGLPSAAHKKRPLRTTPPPRKHETR